MIGDIMQPTHLLFVLVIALLVLGPKRLPEVGRQLGKGLRDFRGAINGEQTDHHDAFGRDSGPTSEVDQAPPQPVEHQFAHETPADAPPHQFAHETSADAPVQPADPPQPLQTADASPSDQSAQTGDPGHQADAGASGSAGEHEFAYESSQPAEKPADHPS